MQQLIVMLPMILIAGVFGYYKYLLSPMNEKSKQLRDELEKIKNEYQESARRAARLPQLEKEIAVLNGEITEIEKKLPASKDLPSLIRMLSKKMNAHDIAWQRIVPGSQVVKDYYIEHAYTIPFNTTYHDLAMFLSEVGQMERIFATRFSKLSTITDAKNGTKVMGELTFLIYTSRT